MRAWSHWPCDAKKSQLSVTALITLLTVPSVFGLSSPSLAFLSRFSPSLEMCFDKLIVRWHDVM